MSFAEAIGNRIAPIFAKAAVGDANAHGGLTALVFIDANQAGDFLHIGRAVAGLHDVRGGFRRFP